MQLPLDVDLSLGDVASQIGDRVSDIVIRHSQDRNLRDRAVSTGHTTCPLVDCRQICVHITWETSAARHLLTGS